MQMSTASTYCKPVQTRQHALRIAHQKNAGKKNHQRSIFYYQSWSSAIHEEFLRSQCDKELLEFGALALAFFVHKLMIWNWNLIGELKGDQELFSSGEGNFFRACAGGFIDERCCNCCVGGFINQGNCLFHYFGC